MHHISCFEFVLLKDVLQHQSVFLVSFFVLLIDHVVVDSFFLRLRHVPLFFFIFLSLGEVPAAEDSFHGESLHSFKECLRPNWVGPQVDVCHLALKVLLHYLVFNHLLLKYLPTQQLDYQRLYFVVFPVLEDAADGLKVDSLC